MNTKNRIVHVLFVLVLLLGITPITMGAPAAGSAPAAPAPPDRSGQHLTGLAPSEDVGAHRRPTSPTALPVALPGDNSFGDLDLSYHANIDVTVNDRVYALAFQPDGKLLIGGDLNTASHSSNLVRVDAMGVSDGTTFDIVMGQFDTRISAIAVQPDGKIIIAGDFNEAIPEFKTSQNVVR